MKKWSFLLGAVIVVVMQAQIAGVRNIPSANYPTIASAFDSLNTYGVGQGGVTFIVQGGYVESITNVLLLTATGTAAKPIEFTWDGIGPKPKIQRTDGGSVSTSILGGYGDAVIQFSGTDYLTWRGIDIASLNQGIEYGILTHKPDGTNGCQNILIEGSKIQMTSGSSGYVMGIYIGNGTTSPSSATGVTVSVPSGKNKNIFLSRDTIVQTHAGIYVRGFNSANLCDSAISIDRCAVWNYGGGNASATYGIYYIYARDLAVTNNNIVSNNHTSTLYGIFFSSGVLGNLTVNNNFILLGNTSVNSVTYYIYNGNTVNNETYLSNIFQGNNFSSTGSVYFIYSSNGTLNKTISGNQVTLFNRTATSGTTYGYYNLGSPGSGWENIVNNAFNNITIAGSSSFYGIYTYTASGHNHLVRLNQFNNITVGTGTSYLVNVQSGQTAIIDSNVIGNTNITAGGNLYGIFVSNLANATIEKNQISNLQTSGSILYGLSISGTNLFVNRNTIQNLRSTNTSPTVVGIYVNGGNSVIQNNIITELYSPNVANNTNAVRGVQITSSATSVKLYNNSIYLDATAPSATNFGTSAIFADVGPSVEIINNIIINNSTPMGTGLTVAYRRSGTTISTYATSSNYNIFYVNAFAANCFYYSDGTNNFNNFNNFKLFVSPRESMSQTELTPFINVAVSPYDLHVKTNVPTFADEGGIPLTSVVTDIDGQPRHPQSPDIGADEFTGIPIYTCTAPVQGNTLASQDSICLGNSVTLSIAPTSGTGVVYQWQKSIDGVNFINIPGNSPNVVVTPGEPTFYRCVTICKAGPDTVASIPVLIDFKNKVLSYTSGSVCGEQVISITATGNPGTGISWFSAPVGGTFLNSGNVFQVPTISSDTAFYASAWTMTSSNIAIGAGSLTSTSYESPFYHLYGGLKTQYLILASELQSVGFTGGNINSISFEVTSVGVPYQNFTLSMGTTSQNAMTTTFVSGLQQVYAVSSFTPVVGVNTITFTNPFYWDGTSNLVIEFCWSNNNTGGTSSHVKYDNTPYVAEAYYRADNQPASTLCAVTTATSTLSRRPKFGFNVQSFCYSFRVKVPVTYVSAPPVSIISVDTICTGQNVLLQASSPNAGYSYTWLPGNVTGNIATFAPTVNTIYTLIAEDLSGGPHNGCKTHTDKLITVGNVFPVIDSVVASALKVCEGTLIDLHGYYNTSYSYVDTLLSESFESGALPTGWVAQTDVDGNGVNATFYYVTSSSYPTGFTPQHGNRFLRFNSYSISDGNMARLITPVINTFNFSNLHLSFYWTNDDGYPNDPDRMIIQYSFDKNSWFNIDSVTRYGTSDQWINVDLSLPSVLQNTNFYLGFLFVSSYGNDCHVDYINLYGQFSDTLPATVYWTSNPPMTLPDSNIITNVLLNTTTTFTFHVRNAFYCEDSKNATVMVIPYPVVNLPNTVTSEVNDTVNLDAGNPGASYQWFVNNSLTDTTQTINLVSSVPDTLHVKVIVTNEGLCSTTDSTVVIFYVVPVGLTDEMPTIRIYPNPASDNIYLQFDKIEVGDYNLTVVSLRGDVMYSAIVALDGTPIRLNVGSYPAGQYFIHLCSNQIEAKIPLIIIR
ncbi:MAG: hypothetical protein N2Z72_04655 [Bacteroidales bacterium]|nr:hypothetical protein [Bacteroidales bacterium]